MVHLARGIEAAPEQGEKLASGGACNSLRAGRATRFGRGVQVAPGGANNSLRAGRATRSERGGRKSAESTTLFNCRFLKLHIFQLFPAPIECKVLEYIICAQARFRLRAASSEKLDCG